MVYMSFEENFQKKGWFLKSKKKTKKNTQNVKQKLFKKT